MSRHFFSETNLASPSSSSPLSTLPSTVLLSLSAQYLREDASYRNPQCLVSLYDRSGRCRELGRTETLLDSLNPQWEVRIQVGFVFEQPQSLRFDM